MKNKERMGIIIRRMMQSNVFSRFSFAFLILFSFLCSTKVQAQYNVDRLITSGRVAVYYEDYILGIQYFNQVIAMKPYLYEPWHYRAIAKYHLDDYHGAEADVSEAIKLNPYITSLYDLRGISRIRIGDYEGAIADYNKALSLDPTNQNFWYNRAACRVETKDYERAHLELDTIITKWKKYASPYLLKCEAYLQQKDTLKATEWLDKALEVDPYNAEAWRLRGGICMSKSEWKDADEYLSKAIHLKPKKAGNYINRAVARLRLNNLRGAMSDYNLALDLEPNNFLAHYNRGLLRQQVGDDNNAIEDFNYVLALEPNNMMALFNRATLLDRTGDLKAAIADYTKVIDEFPNFWTGLHYRAACYRRLGMNAKAEMDEFRILKAQNDKHLGKQARWSRKKLEAMRKKSEIDPNKYDQIVVEDEQTDEHEYKSEYRGKVQNHRVDSQYQPYISLSLFDYSNAMTNYHPFVAEVDEVNRRTEGVRLTVSTISTHLTNEEIKKQFDITDALSAKIANTQHLTPITYLARSVAYCIGQNYGDALKDVDAYLAENPNSALGWWHRAVCNARQADYETGAEPQTAQLRLKSVNADFERAESLDKDNAYILYCHGTFLAHRQDYDKAIQYFTRAVALDVRLAEAYFNRGMAYYYKGDKVKGNADLSKAGELGLYSAYSIIKSNSKK